MFPKSKSRLIRWTKQFESMRTLSLRQPWAWLVVNGYKDIENRSWRTNHRGPLLIHASSNQADFTPQKIVMIQRKYGVFVPSTVEFGGIVRVVEVVDCVGKHSSKWKFRDSWGWILQNPRRLPFRECKGAVGFFRLKSR
jgi:hypothetical protein